MNGPMSRPSSSTVVTPEVACHAGGRGFESRRSRQPLDPAKARRAAPSVTSPAMHLLARIRAAADRAAARVMLVGADPADDDDLRARKALLVLISVLILPV